MSLNADYGRREIGLGCWYETAVVKVKGEGEHGEGVVVGDHNIFGYEGEEAATAAEEGHFEWCRKVAAGWTPEDGDGGETDA